MCPVRRREPPSRKPRRTGHNHPRHPCTNTVAKGQSRVPAHHSHPHPVGRGLAVVEGAGRTGTGDVDAEVRERLLNGRDYMQWLQGYHRKMLEEWEAFKAARDDTDPPETP